MNSIQLLNSLQQRYGTADWTKWQRFEQPYYDYVWYPGAGVTSSLSFFSIAQGGRDPNAIVATQTKNEEDTNFKTARQITPNYLYVAEIRTHLRLAPKNRQNATIAASAQAIYRDLCNSTFQSQLAQFFRGARLRIVIDNKEYTSINQPLTSAPAGFGLNFTSFASDGLVAPAVAQHSWVQSDPDSANVYAVDPPIVIAPSQIIDAFLDWPAGDQPVLTNTVAGTTPSVQIGVILHGLVFRSAQ